MFGERLQKVRKKLKLSQEDMSTQMGTSYRAYSSYEREDRKPPIDFLEKLVNLYSVNLNYLIAGIGNEFLTPEFKDVKDEILKEVEKMLKAKGL